MVPTTAEKHPSLLSAPHPPPPPPRPSHSAITSVSPLCFSISLTHTPTDVLPPTSSPLRALDECGGLIAFFGERISMSCRECSGLMHKEQAARAQKWGPGIRRHFFH